MLTRVTGASARAVKDGNQRNDYICVMANQVTGLKISHGMQDPD